MPSCILRYVLLEDTKLTVSPTSQKITKTLAQTKTPWILLGFSFVTVLWSAVVLFWLTRILQKPFCRKPVKSPRPFFTIVASLAIFNRTKGAWTISLMGWLTTLGISLTLLPTFHSSSTSLLDPTYLIASSALLLVNLALAVFYMRHPYLDSRSTKVKVLITITNLDPTLNTLSLRGPVTIKRYRTVL
jgi:hypothetical protein